MAETSQRAARAPRRGGQPNALFIATAAEAVPPELIGQAARVTVRFPWASLLRGCLGRDAAIAAGIASLVFAGGELELLLAPATRDQLADLPTEPARIIEAAAGAFEPHGLRVVAARPASTDEIRASDSTWAKRLLHGNRHASETLDRAVVLVRLRS